MKDNKKSRDALYLRFKEKIAVSPTKLIPLEKMFSVARQLAPRCPLICKALEAGLPFIALCRGWAARA